jgi:3-oxoacyl-[acyl-carrier protein] reductase
MNPAALITGASRGIGRGIAIELAGLGYDLVINYASNAAAAGQTANECIAAAKARNKSIRAEPCQADVAKTEDRARLIQFTRDTFGRLDILVNNAGVAPDIRADILDASEASFDRLISTNVKGPYFLTQLAARWMLESNPSAGSGAGVPPATPGVSPSNASRAETGGTPAPLSKDASGSRKIITISSISAYTASTNRGDYCIAKAALSMLTPLFAARLAEHGINVYEIRPGIIATDMTGPVKEKYDKLIGDGLTPIRRWGSPGDVGKAVAAIAQDLLPFSTGEVLNVDGGFHLRRL